MTHSLVKACDKAIEEIAKTYDVLDGKYVMTNHKKKPTTKVVITLLVQPKEKQSDK